VAQSQDQAQKTPNYTYFNFAQQNPDAIVILNRGSSFEQDLTGSVISFSTSNSIDSISGSFSVVLDNTNDALVNRFGFTNIKKMSSIEIFSKNPNSDPDPKSRNFVVSKSVRVSGGPDDGTIQQLVKRYYGHVANLEDGNSYVDYVRDGVNELNKKRTQKLVVAYEVHSYDIISNSDNNIAEVQVFIDASGGGGEIKFVPITPLDKPYKNIQVKSFLDNPPTDTGDGGFFRWDQNLTFTIDKDESESTFDPRLKQVDAIIASSRLVNDDSGDPIYEKDVLAEKYKGTYIKLPAPKNAYPRIFYGIVIGVSQNIQPGSNLTITINGKGIGYWLEASMVNTFPGGYEQTLVNLDLSQFANRYAAFPAIEIFKDLIRFSTDDLVATSNFSTDTFQTQSDFLMLLGERQNSQNDVFGKPQTIKQVSRDPTGKEISKDTNQKNNFETKDTTAISKKKVLDKVLISIYRGFAPDNAKVSSDWSRLSAQYVASEKVIKDANASLIVLRNERTALLGRQATMLADAFKKESKNLTSKINDKERQISQAKSKMEFVVNELTEKVSDSKVYIKAIQFQQEELNKKLKHDLQKGRQALFEQFGIIKHWKDIFSTIILEVLQDDSFLNLVYPFKWDIREPGANMDGEYTSKAALGQTVAERIFYEFYFDTNGHFVLKPPLYNIKPEGTSGASASNDYQGTYIIDDNDIISMSMNDTSEGIVTRVGVAGDYKESPGIEKTMIYNIFQDLRLIRDYGFFAQEKAELLFIHNNAEARDFGRAWMSKNNMDLVNASVTIIGRPEIRLGTTVWIKPRDTYYYVREISHSLSAGGDYQTTLTLTGGRRIILGFKQSTEIFQVKRNTIQQTAGNETNDPQPTLIAGGVSNIVHYVPIFQSEEPVAFDSFNLNATDENYALINQIKNEETEIIKQKKVLDAIGPSDVKSILPQGQKIAALRKARNQTINLLRVPLYNAGQPLPTNDDDAATFIMQSNVEKSRIPQILKNMYVITNHINPAYIGLIVSSTDSGSIYKQINEDSYTFFNKLSVKDLPTNVSDLQLDKKEPNFTTDVIRTYFNNYIKNTEPFKSSTNKPGIFTVADREKFVLKLLSDITLAITTGYTTGSYLSLDASIPELTNSAGKNKLASVAKVLNYLIADIDTHQGFYSPYTDADGREFPAYLDYGKSLVIEAGQAKIDVAQQAQTASESKKTSAAAKASKAAGLPSGDNQAFLIALAKKNAKSDASTSYGAVVREVSDIDGKKADPQSNVF
jgi:hypothetical protein